MTGPLAGLRIVEIGDGPAIAFAGRNFADLGAEVVKIEAPEGDEIRRWPGPKILGEPGIFHALNRGKSSMVLDLNSASGIEALKDLLNVADGCVDGTDAGLARQLGPDRLVIARISPYGEGIHSPAHHEATLQAESGFLAINGRPDFPPVRTGLPMIAQGAGASAAHGMLAALIAREDDGEGEDIDIALYDQGVVLSYHYATQYLVNGVRPTRFGNNSPAAAPLGVFQAADGEFQLTVAGERVWKRFVTNMIEMPELADDSRFITNSDRVSNQAALLAILVPLFKSKPRDEWIQKMKNGGVPGGPIRDINEAITAPESIKRNLIVSKEDGNGVPSIRNPLRFRDTPIADPLPAPGLNVGGGDIFALWKDNQ
jgi:crotonobetainyl-CoA:carnitine CoA-transferase CaiB-like acyl-CoA transferase